MRDLKNEKQTPSRTPWWLLLLRLFALALAIIALAGPIRNALTEGSASGPVIVVLDDSWAAAPNWREREKALSTIAAEATRDQREVWLMTTTPRRAGNEEQSILGPMAGADLNRLAQTIDPRPFAADRAAFVQSLALMSDRLADQSETKPDIFWLSDETATDNGFSGTIMNRALARLGNITVWRDTPNNVLALAPLRYQADQLEATVLAAAAAEEDRQVSLTVTAGDGRFLAAVKGTLLAEQRSLALPLDLPLSLRNEIAAIRLDGAASAGGVQLVDASARRVRVGLAEGEDFAQSSLLDGAYYIRQALAPYALFSGDTIEGLIKSGTDVIVLDDVGRLRLTDVAALENWVDEGGILLRFSGPALADSVIGSASQPALLPVPMRGGGRAFGGALTWETPQRMGDFSKDSPFADLKPDTSLEIRRQVLARPGTETATRSWAYLSDGTPLVTAKKQENGLIVLVHVTATPSWSDLPISGVFVDMLRRIITLAPGGLSRADPETTFAPLRMLDGFGRYARPPAGINPVTTLNALDTGTPQAPPGLYGSPDTPLAINAVTSKTQLVNLEDTGIYNGMNQRSYTGTPPQELAPWFFMIAALLLAVDALIALKMQGKLLPQRANAAGALMLCVCLMPIMLASTANAQSRRPIDPKALETAEAMRFGHIITGDSSVDTLAEAGLNGLTYELNRRTAVEPEKAISIDLERDDINVYPLLYWPVRESTPVPSEMALAKLERFMASGGLLIIDTADGERAATGQLSPEGSTLRQILEQMNIPPLEPLPADHVLGKSFYLMQDLPGRNNGGPVWVEARNALSGSNGNDGVTSIIIGGRDWAAAWATNANGMPLRPMGRRQGFTRETAYRAGINMAMIALTGNYKEDQVHVTKLLEKLGAE